MSTQMERMKQLIEAKKAKNTQDSTVKRPTKNSGGTTCKGFNNKKSGGAFDK